MRDPAEWTDRLYKPRGLMAHYVPFGGEVARCGMHFTRDEWMGTGTWGELEKARALRTCPRCEAACGVTS